MRALRRHAGDRPDMARAVRVISNDEDNHLAYCHEELLRLAAGIRGVYACERPGGWRRMVLLRMPARRNALGGPVPAQASHA
jgi:hypothetical protein